MSRAPITTSGADRLRAELDELKKVKRPTIIQAIAEAREHGDLKENAEYHAAREQQSFTEGRIQQIEGTLSNADIIDVITVGKNAGSKIVFGATVELFDVNEEKDVSYQIVGELEADIKLNLISITSPIARALIGKSPDDVAVVQAPSGDREYEVISVRYK
ncbi:Transcription elongation factor GreA [hydrothermal vent metagenome]|uniref:Transcription elongation factor GreA n=1 Tax=hydrothermal vent metagenome TaxID=652676 RepID=A0A3B1AHS8_9ZZZZ